MSGNAGADSKQSLTYYPFLSFNVYISTNVCTCSGRLQNTVYGYNIIYQTLALDHIA